MSHEKEHSHTKAFVGVWLALMVLTVVTVYVSYLDFGSMNIVVAMFVACVKALLVCLYFMHLKYDNKVNQATLVISVIFIGIFVFLTLGDIAFRKPVEAAKVSAIKAPEGNVAEKMLLLSKQSPEQIAQGKTLYSQNCAACHGAEGNGDGASSLNPPPRNFHKTDNWKFGRSPAQIFATLEKGSPGTAMSSFKDTLSLEKRWALAHYINSITPDKPADTPATLAAVGITGDVKPSSTPQKVAVELPIKFALEKYVAEQAGK